MPKALKYICYVTAALLVGATSVSFIMDAIFQANFNGLDGPLAWYSAYAFALNDISLAFLLAAVLIFEFDFRYSRSGYLAIRVLSGVCVLLSVIGFAFLTWEYLFLQQMSTDEAVMANIGILFLFQLAFILVSTIVFIKTNNAKSSSAARE